MKPRRPKLTKLVYKNEAFDLGLPRDEWQAANVAMPIATPKSLVLVIARTTEKIPEPELLGVYVMPREAVRSLYRALERIRNQKPSWFSGH